jgi:hypothetical protein
VQLNHAQKTVEAKIEDIATKEIVSVKMDLLDLVATTKHVLIHVQTMENVSRENANVKSALKV